MYSRRHWEEKLAEINRTLQDPWLDPSVQPLVGELKEEIELMLQQERKTSRKLPYEVHAGGTMSHLPNPPSPAKTPTPAFEPVTELENLIRERAFELFVEGGREGGHELEDWLQAESEITGKKSVTA